MLAARRKRGGDWPKCASVESCGLSKVTPPIGDVQSRFWAIGLEGTSRRFFVNAYLWLPGDCPLISGSIRDGWGSAYRRGRG